MRSLVEGLLRTVLVIAINRGASFVVALPTSSRAHEKVLQATRTVDFHAQRSSVPTLERYVGDLKGYYVLIIALVGIIVVMAAAWFYFIYRLRLRIRRQFGRAFSLY